jgi:hypothetical protein
MHTSQVIIGMKLFCIYEHTNTVKGRFKTMTKHTKKGGSNTKQNKKSQPKHKTSNSQNGQNGYH